MYSKSQNHPSSCGFTARRRRHSQAKELSKKLAHDLAKGEKKGKATEQIMQRYAEKLYELEQQMFDVQVRNCAAPCAFVTHGSGTTSGNTSDAT